MHRPAESVLISTILVLLVGCPGAETGDDDTTEEASWGCDTLEVEVGLDEVHPDIGFSAAAVLANLEGSYVEDIAWWDDSSSEITVEIESRGEAHVLEKEPYGVEAAPDGELDHCFSRLVVSVDTEIQTADQRLDLSFPHSVLAAAVDEGSMNAPPSGTILSPDGDGTFVLDHDEWQEIVPVLRLGFAPGLVSGTYMEYGENWNGSGNELLEETEELVAEWPPTPR